MFNHNSRRRAARRRANRQRRLTNGRFATRTQQFGELVEIALKVGVPVAIFIAVMVNVA